MATRRSSRGGSSKRPRYRKPRSATTSDGAEKRAPAPAGRGRRSSVLGGSWPAWASRLVIVKSDTVAEWNRARFRQYWTRISSTRYPGRPRLAAEIHRLIRTMAQNGWGAPHIHAELTKLGFIVSEVTVSLYMLRQPAEPDQVKRWVAFLRNHKDGIAAMALFTVPTASLRLLFGFFVIEHGRRHIVHFNATFHPTAAWVIQQLRETFPYDTAPRYLVFDRDSIFSPAVVEFIRAMGTKPVRISFRNLSKMRETYLALNIEPDQIRYGWVRAGRGRAVHILSSRFRIAGRCRRRGRAGNGRGYWENPSCR